MKSYVLTAAILMAVSGFAVQAHADTTKADKFVEKASISGMFEIESSKIALERSTNAEVKAFAQQMIDDHTKADAGLKAAAKQANVEASLQKSLDEKHQKIITKLKEVEADKFDKKYLDEQEDAHDDAVELFEDYAEKGDNADLKKFAADTLPTLKAHDHKVEALEDNKQATK